MKKPRKKRKHPNGCKSCLGAGNGKKRSCWSKHTPSVVQQRKGKMKECEELEDYAGA